MIRDLLQTASPQQIAEIKDLLSGRREPRATPQPVRVDRVALIGLRGAGKSTLGRLAAEKLCWPFIELNKETERENGFSMTEIFSLYGQDGVRRLEQATLRKIIDLSLIHISKTHNALSKQFCRLHHAGVNMTRAFRAAC